MATFVTTTVNNVVGSAGASVAATRAITAGDAVIAFVKWEDSQTLSSVTDSAGGTWAIATQQAHGSAPQPIGAIAYCLSHPGGASVTVTANFSGTASALLEIDLLCFRPPGGQTFALDGVMTPVVGSTGAGANFNAGGNTITTTAAGFVVQFLAGFQNTTGVAAGGSPTFTRDTVTENASGTTFGQYLLSGSAQTVTPGCSWGAAGNKFVLLAAAFKEVTAGASPNISSTSASSVVPGSSLTITGTNFGASQGAGSVQIGNCVQQVTAWSDTSITITTSRQTCKYGSQSIVVRDNSLAASNAYGITYVPPAGWSYIDLTSVNSTAEFRLRTSPDLASGDQIAYTTDGGIVVAADATFSWVFGARAFDFEVWTSADGWGGIVSQYLLPPVDPRAAYDALAIDYRMNAARKASAFKLHPSTWGVTPLVPAKWVADELVTAAGGGGSSYNVTLAEAAAASDAIGSAMLQVAALAEAATAADAYAAQAAFVRALAEAAAAGDVQAAALLALAALTEPAVAAEALTAGLALGASALEAAAAADSQVAALLAAAAAAEAAAAADAAAAGLLAGAAVTEAAAAADAQSTGPVLAGAVSESVTLADALAAVAALLASMVEAAAAADSAAAQMTRTGAVSEAAAAAEAQTTGPQVSASLAETVAAAESLATAMNLVAQIAEAGTAAEVLNTAAALGALLTEPAVPVDSIAATAAATYSASVAETVSALEAIVALLVSGAFNPSAPPQLRREAAARLANIQAATRGRNTNRGTR